MRTFFGKKKPMNAVSSLSRDAAAALVEREARVTGSRMVAYERVGQTVGASGEWLRGFIKGYERAKEPSLTVGFNLMAHFKSVYGMTCDRIEQKAADERKLREEIDAAFESIGLLVDGEEGTISGASKTSRVD